MLNTEEMRGTRPAGVSSHSMKPGTFSVIIPPRADAGGPQQGGLSLPDEGGQQALSSPLSIFRMLLILNCPGGPLFTCSMQSYLPAVRRHQRPWQQPHSTAPAT